MTYEKAQSVLKRLKRDLKNAASNGHFNLSGNEEIRALEVAIEALGGSNTISFVSLADQ